MSKKSTNFGIPTSEFGNPALFFPEFRIPEFRIPISEKIQTSEFRIPAKNYSGTPLPYTLELKETLRVKGNSKPWFDGSISERINIRDKLKKKFKKTGLQVDYENFKTTQNQVKCLIKAKKCDYVKDQLKENIAKPSKLWKVLKSLGLSSKSNSSKICLKENGTAYFEPTETSGIFKKFYENLAQSLVDVLPPSPNIFTMNSTKAYYDQFNIQSTLKLESVEPTIITDLLAKTNTSKAAGIDMLAGTFIKAVSYTHLRAHRDRG